MKAIVISIKPTPYQGPFDIIQKSFEIKTEYNEILWWHVRSTHKETSLNADIGHIFEGLELTENRSGKKIIDYVKSDPRVINRQFVISK